MISPNQYAQNIYEDDLKWIEVDLDGTLAEPVWPEPGIGKPKNGAVEAIQLLHEKGYKIIVYTARPWSDYLNIEKWLNDNLIPFRRIVCGKPLVKYSIDDRNIEFKGSWKEVLSKILL